jgi:hypothetical protein
VRRLARIRRVPGDARGKAIGYLPLLVSMTGVACASSQPAIVPSVGTAVAAPQLPQVAVEAKGKRIVIALPEGFTREPVEPSKLGDVLVASATRPGKYQIRIFYDPDVSVSNGQIPEFGRYLVATAGKNLPNFELGSNGVVTGTRANVFFVSFVDAKDDAMGAILIRSLAGSPVRVMLVGPRTIDGVRVLPVVMKQMVDTLGSAGDP